MLIIQKWIKMLMRFIQMINPLDKKLQDTKFKADMDELGIQEDELIDKYTTESSFSKDSKDKMTSLKKVAELYEMELKGKKLKEDNNRLVYIQESKALAGSSFIRLSSAILGSYAEESNLIAKKSKEDATNQLQEGYYKVSSFMLRDRTIKEEHHRMILQIFKARLWNIIDVITNTDGNMQRVIGGLPENVEDIQELNLGGLGNK